MLLSRGGLHQVVILALKPQEYGDDTVVRIVGSEKDTSVVDLMAAFKGATVSWSFHARHFKAP